MSNALEEMKQMLDKQTRKITKEDVKRLVEFYFEEDPWLVKAINTKAEELATEGNNLGLVGDNLYLSSIAGATGAEPGAETGAETVPVADAAIAVTEIDAGAAPGVEVATEIVKFAIVGAHKVRGIISWLMSC